jgi:dihydroorotate dehydrogenase electron transfer subunit
MNHPGEKHEQPIVLPIKKIVEEAKDLKTFVLEYPLKSEPGQFIMAWIPRLDSKPFAVSFQDKKEFHFAVLAVGPFTKKMMELKEGDKIGFFGPYGNSFDISGKRIALVGGGCGTPPLKFAAIEAMNKGIEVDFIMGARDKDHIAYADEFEKLDMNVFITTDDGSLGEKGYTTDVLKKRLEEVKYDCIYTCGPEIMMQAVMDIADEHDIRCQVSMERYMKCGFGVCGQCAVDGPGVPICKKGPVFEKDMIKKITEFGKYRRDASGAKVDFSGKPVCER